MSGLITIPERIKRRLKESWSIRSFVSGVGSIPCIKKARWEERNNPLHQLRYSVPFALKKANTIKTPWRGFWGYGCCDRLDAPQNIHLKPSTSFLFPPVHIPHVKVSLIFLWFLPWAFSLKNFESSKCCGIIKVKSWYNLETFAQFSLNSNFCHYNINV